jgi:hypothetical protein
MKLRFEDLLVSSVVLMIAMGLTSWGGNSLFGGIFQGTPQPTTKVTRTPTPTGPTITPGGPTVTRTPTPTGPTHTPTPTILGGATSTPTRTPTPNSPTNTPTPVLVPLRTNLSPSKLSFFALNNTNGTKNLIKAGPKVIKVIDPQSNSGTMQLIRDYKQMYPNGIVIMRVYENTPGLSLGSKTPDSAANDFWNIVLNPAINQLSASDRNLIDYIAGPNEEENIPLPDSPAQSTWINNFWIALSTKICGSSTSCPTKPKPLMGEINVTHPDKNYLNERLNPLIPALRIIKQLGGAWSYHAYTYDFSTDVNQESGTSLNFRNFYNYFQNNATDLMDLPIFLTEGGIDCTNCGSKTLSGWQSRTVENTYKNWLTWFDSKLMENGYVGGLTLFQIGSQDSNFTSFDIESISSWLTNYIATK